MEGKVASHLLEHIVHHVGVSASWWRLQRSTGSMLFLYDEQDPVSDESWYRMHIQNFEPHHVYFDAGASPMLVRMPLGTPDKGTAVHQYAI